MLEFNLSTAQAQATDRPSFTYLSPSTKDVGEQESLDPHTNTKPTI